MSNQSNPVAVTAADVPPRSKPSVYPEPFASRMAGREKRQLGEVFGLTNFGVNLARLAPHAPHVQARPEAAALLRLAPALLAQGLALAADAALPLYVRNKVAQTTAERAAKAAQTGATAP